MTTINRSARVGVITDQAGALSVTGIANVNVAPPVDNLGRADRGHVPGLTRQVQAGLAGGVAALYPNLTQKTA
jgi:hypothetical protein